MAGTRAAAPDVAAAGLGKSCRSGETATSARLADKSTGLGGAFRASSEPERNRTNPPTPINTAQTTGPVIAPIRGQSIRIGKRPSLCAIVESGRLGQRYEPDHPGQTAQKRVTARVAAIFAGPKRGAAAAARLRVSALALQSLTIPSRDGRLNVPEFPRKIKIGRRSTMPNTALCRMIRRAKIHNLPLSSP